MTWEAPPKPFFQKIGKQPDSQSAEQSAIQGSDPADQYDQQRRYREV